LRQGTRCASRTRCLLATVALAELALRAAGTHAQSTGLIPGVDEWAAAVTKQGAAKWVGQRVPWPPPQQRPVSTGYLDSLEWPLRVHTTRAPAAGERGLASAVLKEAEASVAMGQAVGLFRVSAPLELFLVATQDGGAFASEASVWSELDSVAAYGVVDSRVPRAALGPCTAQALLEALLLAGDPAENASVRTASAAYFAWLMHGQSCGDAQAGALFPEQLRVLHTPALLARWLRALGAEREQNRGLFLADMWQFARQTTWEGDPLRGSPDLLEVIAKIFELSKEHLEESAAELSLRMALDEGVQGLRGVRFSALPAHLPVSPALATLDASLALVDLEMSRPQERLRIWARGEAGVRWALGAVRLRENGSVIAFSKAAVRKVPEAELQLELSEDTRFVLISVVNMGLGVPDPDRDDHSFDRAVRLIIDRAR
jgi:hypothetical protein